MDLRQQEGTASSTKRKPLLISATDITNAIFFNEIFFHPGVPPALHILCVSLIYYTQFNSSAH